MRGVVLISPLERNFIEEIPLQCLDQQASTREVSKTWLDLTDIHDGVGLMAEELEYAPKYPEPNILSLATQREELLTRMTAPAWASGLKTSPIVT